MAKKKTKEIEQETVNDRPYEEEKLPAVVEENKVYNNVASVSVGMDPYYGASTKPVSESAAAILMAPLDPLDVEIRPDGIVYLPEIKYRRILNRAFGPGGWALVPRGEIDLRDNVMSRDYALYVGGRFVSEARGECEYIPSNNSMTYPSVLEGCKSSALMRTCKDLGIASDLWDPCYIRQWQSDHAVQVWRKGSQRPQWRRKDRDPFYDEGAMVSDGKLAFKEQPQQTKKTKKSEPKPQPQEEQKRDPKISLRMEINAFIANKVVPDLTEQDIPDLLQRLTSYSTYVKKEASGNRQVPGFDGVRSFDDPRFSTKMAEVALRKFKTKLKELQP